MRATFVVLMASLLFSTSSFAAAAEFVRISCDIPQGTPDLIVKRTSRSSPVVDVVLANGVLTVDTRPMNPLFKNDIEAMDGVTLPILNLNGGELKFTVLGEGSYGHPLFRISITDATNKAQPQTVNLNDCYISSRAGFR